jgi:hypothetical protein
MDLALIVCRECKGAPSPTLCMTCRGKGFESCAECNAPAVTTWGVWAFCDPCGKADEAERRASTLTDSSTAPACQE